MNEKPNNFEMELMEEILRQRDELAGAKMKQDRTADEVLRQRAEISQLREALKPFALRPGAVALSTTLGHITREDLLRAADAYGEVPRDEVVELLYAELKALSFMIDELLQERDVAVDKARSAATSVANLRREIDALKAKK